ncbi:conserved hypothetical protein [uncultured Stenotrophomonas sp.]|uniref:Uncharacterized protein n=1 Tax=uncultured Stenotrophomonas sp. TaxID=165438 RepID=A0A1Y5Q8K5_9GAMM|nr:conserved hypothetical protein [uncultured Stenotrophomonas sp.]
MPGSRRIIAVESSGRRVQGRTFLYVLPCAHEDHAKLGIATDPMTRMQAFSTRYFEFFDLDAGWLLEAEAETGKEARDWETGLKRQLRPHAAPAPLLVPDRAGGRTEWLRGALPALAQWREARVAQGFVAHAPLRDWVRTRLQARQERWSHEVQALVGHFGPPEEWPAAAGCVPLARLRDLLDAHAVLDVALADAVPAELRTWHRRNSSVPW